MLILAAALSDVGKRWRLSFQAINGAAVTGGFELALGCDILLGSTKARFRDTHCRFGIVSYLPLPFAI